MAKHLNVDDDAPYGRKNDGSPRARPGRQPAAQPKMVPDAAHAGPPVRRNNPRPAPRQAAREQLTREPSRATATVTGRNGEILTRSHSELNGDIFERAKAPAGWSYQWNSVSAINKDLSEIQAGISNDMRANGWRPVPASRHPGVWTPPGFDGAIIVKGQRLEERPISLTKDALREDEIRAKAQVRDQTDALKLTQSQLPGAQERVARQATGMKMSIDKSFEVPPDEYEVEG